MSKRLNIIPGEKFGKLTVLSEGGRLRIPSGQINRMITCKCDCGKVKDIRLLHLVRGRIRSCGCLTGVFHGDSGSHLYKVWRSINYRCHESTYDTSYYRRKITVCPEWRHEYVPFRDWAVSNGYIESKKLQIDRKDNKKGYSPDNCRFVTCIVNSNNRENTFMILYNGELTPFMNVIYKKEMFMNIGAIRARINRGWSAQKAIDTPIRKGNYVRSYETKEESYNNLIRLNHHSGKGRKLKKINE